MPHENLCCLTGKGIGLFVNPNEDFGREPAGQALRGTGRRHEEGAAASAFRNRSYHAILPEALRRRERGMNKTAVLAASGLFLLTTLSGSVIAAEQQFICKGQMIEPTGEQTAPIDLKLNLGGPRKTTIELGGGKLNVSVTSDNKIQLKFHETVRWRILSLHQRSVPYLQIRTPRTT
jgi:hypothetical protein